MDGAEKTYRTAIEVDPGGADAHLNLGILLHEEPEEFDAAIEEYRTATEVDPGGVDAHINLGILLENHKNGLEGAAVAYGAAAAIDPEDDEAHAALLRVRKALAARSSEEKKSQAGRNEGRVVRVFLGVARVNGRGGGGGSALRGAAAGPG